ncbi:MAG: hypothetical protein R2731_17950 [Nocardioides sp.]
MRHQRDHLPELAEIAELQRTRAALATELHEATLTLEELTSEQLKIDADVESVKARRQRDRDRMDQGSSPTPRTWSG